MKTTRAGDLAWLAGIGLLACSPAPTTPGAPVPTAKASSAVSTATASSAAPAASASSAVPVEAPCAGAPALVVQRDRVFAVRGLAVAPSGSLLAVTGRALSLRRREGAGWPLVAVYALGGDRLVGAPSFSSDGRWLAVAVGDRAIAVEIATGTRQDVPLPPGESLRGDVAWNPQGDATLALPTGGGVALWSPGAPPRAPLTAAASVSRIAWSADGRSIAAATPKGTVLMNAETGEARRDPGVGGEPILAFSPDGKTLASERFHEVYETRFPGGRPHMPTQAGRVREVVLFEPGVAHSATTLTASARIEAFGPEGKSFLFAERASEEPGTKVQLNVVDMAARASRPLLSQRGISAAAWTQDSRVLVGFDDGAIQIAELAGGKLRPVIDAERDDLFARPRWTKTALLVSVGREGKRRRAFDLATGAALPAQALDAAPRAGAVQSPDGKTSATPVGADLVLRDLATGKTRITLVGAASHFAWTPDSKAIVSANARKILVSEVASGDRTRVFYGADDWVDFAVAPAGTLLAHTAFTGSAPRQLVVSIVDWSTGGERASIPVPVFLEEPMLAWSPNSEVLAIGGPEVLLYRMADGATLHLASFADTPQGSGLAWLDGGAFDGDEAAFAHLSFRMGANLACSPLARDPALLGRFRHPQLVTDFLAGKTR